MRSGDNTVAAGRVVELPDRTAFRLRPMRPDYRGEKLTLVVATDPLAGITAAATMQKLDRTLVDDWERRWAASVERFEMVGGAGKTYTKAEREASAGGRLLTQEDDLPQTLLRVHSRPGAPLLVDVTLPARR